MTNFSDLINRQSEPPSSKSTGIPTASSFTDYSSDGQVCLLVDSPYRIYIISQNQSSASKRVSENV
jgi:hypothetical protein